MLDMCCTCHHLPFLRPGAGLKTGCTAYGWPLVAWCCVTWLIRYRSKLWNEVEVRLLLSSPITVIYMMIDLKVLVRSFNCESRACYVGDPRESFFFEFAKIKFYFAKVSRKLGIIKIICKGLPPTAARGPAGEGHQRMRVAVAKFPKVRLCESQTPRPLVFAFPSVHPLLMGGVCE